MLILYEDSRAATNGFGLHEFVLANVRDVIAERGQEIDSYRLAKLVEASPKKSDSKVLRALKEDAERLHAGSTVIVAWLDDDKLHRSLGLPPGQSASQLIQAIQDRLHPSVPKHALRVHLLRGNVEQFLRRIDSAQPNTFDAETLQGALQKQPTDRDLCFRRAAVLPHRGWRQAVREQDPSFRETIGFLADAATCARWPPWGVENS
ncbi:MAG TPA: hypothetical protein VFK02_06045 [Kofleriaceae bacterium]|nr:hypothetical protein [Kofleriaceae bacterium]